MMYSRKMSVEGKTYSDCTTCGGKGKVSASYGGGTEPQSEGPRIIGTKIYWERCESCAIRTTMDEIIKTIEDLERKDIDIAEWAYRTGRYA